MMLKPLTDLANFYGLNKGTVNASRQREALNYTDVYEAYFSRIRAEKLTVLQIGLGTTARKHQFQQTHGEIYLADGLPLKLWSEYFPAATLYGLDINPCIDLNLPRASSYGINVGDPGELLKFLAAAPDLVFDVIMDDGSHRPEDQQVALSLLFPRLRSGGLYFIEDLMNNGLGDRHTGHHASSAVKNTRAVLRQWQSAGTFAEPNGLLNVETLSRQIAHINFHCPRLIAEGKFRLALKAPVKVTTHYRPRSEQLVALVKL